MLMEYRSEQNYLISLKLSISLDCSNFRSLKSSSYQSTKSLIPCVDNSPTDSCSKPSSKSLSISFSIAFESSTVELRLTRKATTRTSNHTNKTTSIEHRVAQPRTYQRFDETIERQINWDSTPSESLRATTSSLIIESAPLDAWTEPKLFTLPLRKG